MAQAPFDCDPYEQARTDPDFLTAVDAAHHGRWAPLDALWWVSHPLDESPDGTPAPAERLRILQRRVFAADGDAAGNQAVAEAMEALRAEIEEERAAIEGAIAAAGTAEVRTPDPAAAPAGPEEPDDDPDEDVEDVGSDDPGRRGFGTAVASPRGRVLLGACLAGSVALGALLGSNLATFTGTGTGAGTGAGPGAGPDAAESAGPDQAGEAAGQPVLVHRVFERIQTARDVPPVAMPDAFTPESFRYLGSAGWTDADADGVTDSPFYATRTAGGVVCLVVMPEASGYLATCAPVDAFPADGLRLSWQTTDLHPAASGGTLDIVMDITVAWLSDSTVETRGSGRPLANS